MKKYLLTQKSADFVKRLITRGADTQSTPRRTPYNQAGFGGWRQWQVSVRGNKVYVRSGNLAWGGGHTATWPGGRTVLRTSEQSVGQVPDSNGRYYVLWYTRVAGCPLCHCPKQPAGGNACAGAEAVGCCPADDGDPAEWNPDKGDVGIFERAERLEGWTDFRILATLEISGGTAKVNQIQTAEITVRAIAYPNEAVEESGGEPEEDKEECGAGGAGSFPSDVDDTLFPADRDDVEFDGGGGRYFPSKVAACW